MGPDRPVWQRGGGQGQQQWVPFTHATMRCSRRKEAEVNDATSPKLWSGCENELRRWVETEQLIDGRITVLKLVPEDRGQLRELVHCYESKENCRRQIQRLQIPI